MDCCSVVHFVAHLLSHVQWQQTRVGPCYNVVLSKLQGNGNGGTGFGGRTPCGARFHCIDIMTPLVWQRSMKVADPLGPMLQHSVTRMQLWSMMTFLLTSCLCTCNTMRICKCSPTCKRKLQDGFISLHKHILFILCPQHILVATMHMSCH